MPAAAMRFDATPIINALKDVFAIFRDFQFNYYQASIVPQTTTAPGSGSPARPSTAVGARNGGIRSSTPGR